MKKLAWNEKRAKKLGWDIARMKAYYAHFGVGLEPMTIDNSMSKVCSVCEERKPRDDAHWGRYPYPGSTDAKNPRPAGGGRFKNICLACEENGYDSAAIALENRRARARRNAKARYDAERALRASGSAD